LNRPFFLNLDARLTAALLPLFFSFILSSKRIKKKVPRLPEVKYKKKGGESFS
jgi:hypothetical protein